MALQRNRFHSPTTYGWLLIFSVVILLAIQIFGVIRNVNFSSDVTSIARTFAPALFGLLWLASPAHKRVGFIYWFFALLVLAGLANGLILLIENFGLYSHRDIFGLTEKYFPSRYWRFPGLWGNPNDSGALASLSIIAAFGTVGLWWNSNAKLFRILGTLSIVLSLWVLLETQSRSALIAGFVSIAWISLFSFFNSQLSRLLKLFVPIFILIPTISITIVGNNSIKEFFLLGRGLSSFNSRLQHWQMLYNHFDNEGFFNLIFGQGINTFTVYDNSYAFSLDVYGVVGTCIILLPVLLILLKGTRFLISHSRVKGSSTHASDCVAEVLVTTATGMIVFLILQAFVATAFSNPRLDLVRFGALFAVIIACQKNAPER